MPHQDSMYKLYELRCTSYKSKYRMVWILCVLILFNILDCLIFVDDMVTYQNREHYTDVKMVTIASQITSLTIVYSAIYSDADQRKYQNSASLAFVWGIHRRPVNSPHKWPVTRKMLPFDDVIMFISIYKSNDNGKTNHAMLRNNVQDTPKFFALSL